MYFGTFIEVDIYAEFFRQLSIMSPIEFALEAPDFIFRRFIFLSFQPFFIKKQCVEVGYKECFVICFKIIVRYFLINIGMEWHSVVY